MLQHMPGFVLMGLKCSVISMSATRYLQPPL